MGYVNIFLYITLYFSISNKKDDTSVISIISNRQMSRLNSKLTK